MPKIRAVLAYCFLGLGLAYVFCLGLVFAIAPVWTLAWLTGFVLPVLAR